MNQKRVLEYVRNTGGYATKAIFEEDFEPVGPKLWQMYCVELEYIRVDEYGHMRLTAKGESALEGK